MKKIVSGILVVTVMFALVACGNGFGGKNGADPIVGEWALSSMSMGGQEISLEDMGITVAKINITDDGKVSVPAIEGKKLPNLEGAWANDNGSYTLTVDGDSMPVTLDGNKMTLEQDGVVVVFTK